MSFFATDEETDKHALVGFNEDIDTRFSFEPLWKTHEELESLEQAIDPLASVLYHTRTSADTSWNKIPLVVQQLQENYFLIHPSKEKTSLSELGVEAKDVVVHGYAKNWYVQIGKRTYTIAMNFPTRKDDQSVAKLVQGEPFRFKYFGNDATLADRVAPFLESATHDTRKNTQADSWEEKYVIAYASEDESIHIFPEESSTQITIDDLRLETSKRFVFEGKRNGWIIRIGKELYQVHKSTPEKLYKPESLLSD